MAMRWDIAVVFTFEEGYFFLFFKCVVGPLSDVGI